MSFKELHIFFSSKTNKDCADLIMKQVWFSRNSSVVHEFETIIQKIGECIYSPNTDCIYTFLSIYNLKIHSPHLANLNDKDAILYQTKIAKSRLQGRVFNNFYTVDRRGQEKFWKYLVDTEKASLPWVFIRKNKKKWLVEYGPKRPLHILMNYHPKLDYYTYLSRNKFEVLDSKWLA